jgi:hypothetical protein
VTDAGLSAQRTRLAWNRTLGSAAAAGLLALRPAVQDPRDAIALVTAAVAMSGWAALLFAARRRSRRLRAGAEAPGAAPRAVPAAALLVLLLAAAGIAVVLSRPG